MGELVFSRACGRMVCGWSDGMCGVAGQFERLGTRRAWGNETENRAGDMEMKRKVHREMGGCGTGREEGR